MLPLVLFVTIHYWQVAQSLSFDRQSSNRSGSEENGSLRQRRRNLEQSQVMAKEPEKGMEDTRSEMNATKMEQEPTERIEPPPQNVPKEDVMNRNDPQGANVANQSVLDSSGTSANPPKDVVEEPEMIHPETPIQQQQQQPQPVQEPQDYPDESGDYETILIILCILVLVTFVRKKWMQGHDLYRGWSRIHEDSSVMSDDFTYGVSSVDGAHSSGTSKGRGGRGSGSVHNRRNIEMAPLTSTTEDEWGWEASGGDVTDVERGLSLSHGTLQEEENLQVALAMSLSTKQTSSNESSSTTTNGSSSSCGASSSRNSSRSMRRKSSISKEASTTYNKKPTQQPSLPIARKDSWDNEDSWEDAPISSSHKSISSNVGESNKTIPSSTSSLQQEAKGHESVTIEELLAEQTKTMNLPTVTSLSKKKPTTKSSSGDLSKKKAVVEEEDIFSSMGLAATPKAISSNSQTRTTGGGSFQSKSVSEVNKNITTPVAASQDKSVWNSSSLVEEDSIAGGSEWGDDSDLDDLLED